MQVAVFDTAFLTTMPAAAYTYALPAGLAKKEGLRRYGAHGTSYRYLVGAAAKMLGRSASELNMIIGHIGLHAPSCTLFDLSSSSMRAHSIPR